MWFCFNKAFVSIVALHNSDRLLVRSRKRMHLVRLFPMRRDEIETTPERDYRFRITASREEMAGLVAASVKEIDYPNFKNSVKDPGLHDMYSAWWSDHYHYQSQKGL